MMVIRSDQVDHFVAAHRDTKRRELVVEVRRLCPGREAEATALSDRIIEDADALRIAVADWPRLASLLTLPEDRWSRPEGALVFAALNDVARTSDERLTYIERHLMPRLEAEGSKR
ncbi:MAG: hypothetical protein AAGN82_24830 [Myxococcota bacterium]